MKFLLAMVGVGVLAAGCVSTVGGGKTFGVPWTSDTLAGRYQRPLEQVFQAAIEVVKYNGTLISESTLHNETNAVKTVQGKVNERNVWVRMEAVEPTVTAVSVQARTPGGATDLPLAHELEKQIAIKLVR